MLGAIASGLLVEFVVPGRPRPKERPRRGKYGNVYTPAKTQEYERMVAWYALNAMQGFAKLTGSVGVEIKLYFRGKRLPDIDNCAKAIMDGMLEVVYEDDRQVQELRISRYQDKNERAEVSVWPLKEVVTE
jgi:crossover junction endodeoxyribonuclease RusA